MLALLLVLPSDIVRVYIRKGLIYYFYLYNTNHVYNYLHHFISTIIPDKYSKNAEEKNSIRTIRSFHSHFLLKKSLKEPII